MLLVDRHVAAGTVREDFQRLVSEGVANVGLETMKEIKNRIREGIEQQIEGQRLSRNHYLTTIERTSLR